MPEAKKPLIVVCGKYGCGKTTAAHALQKELDGFHLIGIDETRQQMGLFPYRREDTPRILEQMDLSVMRLLRDGHGVIVERPHQTYESRARSYDAAIAFGNPILLVECICPEGVAKARIAARPSSSKVHLPPSNPDVTDRIRKNWEDVSKDFDRNPALSRLVSYIRNFSHVRRCVPVNVTEALRDITMRACRAIEAIKGGPVDGGAAVS